MKIKVRLLALFHDIAGQKETEMELAAGVTAAHVKSRLVEAFPRLAEYDPMLAVNGRYADPHQELREGDEVALLPPFSGGSDD